MKSIRSVKIDWWGVGVVTSLEQSANFLHMVQLMPLHPKPHQLLSHCNPRWYQLIQVFLENRPLLNGCSSRSPCCNHSTCHCCCNAGLSLPDYPASVANTMGHKQAVMWPAWHHHHGNFTNIQHTHTRLTALCLGLLGWAGIRKVKPIWILLKQETVSGSGISLATCKQSAHRSMPAPQHSVFYRLDVLPATQPTVSKHWRHTTN